MSLLTRTCVTARSVGTVCARVAASVIRQTFVDICSNADTVKRHIKGLLGIGGNESGRRLQAPEYLQCSVAGCCFIENGRFCVRNPCQIKESKGVKSLNADTSVPVDQCLYP